MLRWPVESFSIDGYLVLLAPHELVKVHPFSQGLFVKAEISLPSHEVVDGVGVDLPLLYALISWDRLRILSEEVVVWNENGIGASLRNVDCQLTGL